MKSRTSGRENRVRIKMMLGTMALVAAGVLYMVGGMAGQTTGQTTGQKLTPLNIRLGLWEITTTMQRTGLMGLPPDMLAKMTPEQRARYEERLKAQGANANRTTTRKNCVTKEKMEKNSMFDDNRPECKRTVVTSTGSRMEVRAECGKQGVKMTIAMAAEALDSGSIKGTMHMTTSGGERTMEMESTFTGKWVGAACGDVE
jgi:Protein of unknown function (DUF3617)